MDGTSPSGENQFLRCGAGDGVAQAAIASRRVRFHHHCRASFTSRTLTEAKRADSTASCESFEWDV